MSQGKACIEPISGSDMGPGGRLEEKMNIMNSEYRINGAENIENKSFLYCNFSIESWARCTIYFLENNFCAN